MPGEAKRLRHREFKWGALGLSKCHLANSSGALLASQNVISRIQVARVEPLKLSFGEFKWRALRLSKCHLANFSGAL